MSKKIKPCPFCGKPPVVKLGKDDHWKTIACVRGHSVCTKLWRRKEAAIREWNTRK